MIILLYHKKESLKTTSSFIDKMKGLINDEDISNLIDKMKETSLSDEIISIIVILK